MQSPHFLNLSAKALRGWSLSCLTTRETLLYARSSTVPVSRPEVLFRESALAEPLRPNTLAKWLAQDSVSIRGACAESSAAPVPNGPDHGFQSEFEAQVRSLQQYICELLIANQRLRWLLQSRDNDQPKGLADDCE